MNTFWITRDRRETKDEVYEDLVEHRIYSRYMSEDAAKAASYPTETVWKIQIKVTEE